jgi:hypothetical protein
MRACEIPIKKSDSLLDVAWEEPFEMNVCMMPPIEVQLHRIRTPVMRRTKSLSIDGMAAEERSLAESGAVEIDK